jgi:hypothetical protein
LDTANCIRHSYTVYEIKLMSCAVSSVIVGSLTIFKGL